MKREIKREIRKILKARKKEQQIKEFKEYLKKARENRKIHRFEQQIKDVNRMKEKPKIIQIRHKNRCCPEYECLYESWNRKICKICGADCSKCIWNKKENERNLQK